MPGTILVVSDDETVREAVSAWLDSVGLEVMSCPGPTRPEYRCVAGRGRRCALAHATDVVVLDPWLAGDAAMEGTSPHELLSYYRWEGRPVVLLARGGDGRRSSGGEGVLSLPWPAGRGDLLEAVRRAAVFGDAEPVL